MSTILDKVNRILTEKRTKILPGNIKKDVKIFDVTGTLESSGPDTSDATAEETDMAYGKTAYVKGQKIMGTLKDTSVGSSLEISTSANRIEKNDSLEIISAHSTYGESGPGLIIREGSNLVCDVNYDDLAEAIGLTADVIKKGTTILGITGTYEGDEPSEGIEIGYGDELTFNLENLVNSATSSINARKPSLLNERVDTASSGGTIVFSVPCKYGTEDSTLRFGLVRDEFMLYTYYDYEFIPIAKIIDPSAISSFEWPDNMTLGEFLQKIQLFGSLTRDCEFSSEEDVIKITGNVVPITFKTLTDQVTFDMSLEYIIEVEHS